MSSTVAMTGGGKRYRSPLREKDDFYRTPTHATEALLRVERFPGPVWEPACGDGAISRVLEAAGYPVVSTDLVDRGYGASRRDFLMEQGALGSSVVTNPPFKLADEFVLHALALGIRNIAILQRLAWLEGADRGERLWRKHRPARVWVFSKRVTMWRGDDPNARETGGTIPFAWFVWDSAAPIWGTQLGWLP